MSNTLKCEVSQPQRRDRTILTRLQRQLRETEETETIRYALVNGASAVLEREDNDVDAFATARH